MKILAVVLTYFPEKEVLERNVDEFIGHVDKLLVWEILLRRRLLNTVF